MLVYFFAAFVIAFTLYQRFSTPKHEAAVRALWGYAVWVGVGIAVMNFIFIQFLPG
ncbi:MAG: hypothetical protein NXI16_00485 [Alphaproteobacteria bacterium]|nr:hypothetical protein [Alphaproteobacteria bacterium]